jgi:protein-S-isoprenylcysteine O-methyltransferase Ste14
MTPAAFPRGIIPALWIVWLVYWIVAARDLKPTLWREPPRSRALSSLPLILVAILLGAPNSLPPVMLKRFLPPNPMLPTLGTVLVAAGLGFAIWARAHLGRNWSARVTLKEDHSLIRTGPYGRVRHPIYTGMLLALAGTAIAIGEWRGLVAVALAVPAFVRKSRVEEDRMGQTFPEYEQYRRETAALIPFVY